MALDRSQITVPILLQEEVGVASLGGSVIVRGMLLSQRLANDAANTLLRAPLEGESEADARVRAGSQQLPRVLHQCVVDNAGMPLMSPNEWDIFGSRHQAEAFALFSSAMRLSALDPEVAEKN